MRVLAVFVLSACATKSPAIPPSARFANAPPVTVVDDRLDVPQPPKPRVHLRSYYSFDHHIWLPIDRALQLPIPERSLGTNSIDEVPDSTWFTNRVGAREISLEELRASPSGVGNPERHTPWTIHSTKVGGQSVGFIVTDTRGVRFLVKFDLRGVPEAETAAQLITGRLLWACGYNVTDDYVAYVRRSDLVLAPDAVHEDVVGNKRKLDRAMLERNFEMIDVGPDGRIRTMASHFLDGTLLGPPPDRGLRADDPNDRIPHQRRRDLRGARAIFSWLDHIDVQAGQMIDVWIADRDDPRRHYVKHYWLDYGGSLGVMARAKGNPRRGYEYVVDPQLFKSLFTFGAYRRPWENREMPVFLGLGSFENPYDPGIWKPTGPAYLPFVVSDRLDQYWGAKIVMAFSREQIRAAVEAGRLSDPRAVETLIDVIVDRQRKIGAYWFSRVNPIDKVTAHPERVCFDDLLVSYGFDAGASTTYTIHEYDRAGRPFGSPVTVGARRGGRSCAPLALAPGDDGYTIVRVDTARPQFHGTTYVYVAREHNKMPQVIGLYRE